MAGGERLPAKYEDRKNDFASKNFQGVNVQADRTAIAPEEFSWLENLLPIGYANLRTVPGPGASLLTLVPTIVLMVEARINSQNYLYSFTDDGGCTQLDVVNLTTAVVMAPGTYTGTPAAVAWKVDRLLIVAGNNYWDWDGAVLTALGGALSAPSGGTSIAAFAGRVWIGQGRTLSYSAPDSYSDFQLVSAGGVDIISDQTLKGSITALAVANGYLYIFGSSSIDVVSDVRVSAGITIFSRTNVVASIGSPFPKSIMPFYKQILFVNTSGVYALVGTTPKKVSDKIDVFLRRCDFPQDSSAAQCFIEKQLVHMHLFQWADPDDVVHPIIAANLGGKWFFLSQGIDLVEIVTVQVSDVSRVYGTDGHSIYYLFSEFGDELYTKIETALQPHSRPWQTKQQLKVGIETYSDENVQLTVTCDSERSSVPVVSPNEVIWRNANGDLVSWFSIAGPMTWVGAGYQFFQANVEQSGRYIGFTIESTSPQYVLTGILGQFENRATWVGS